MAISINSVKGRLKNEAKNILYSSQGRNSARKTLNLLRTSEKYSTYLENKNFRRILENIASEDLPYGKYFAKITIHNWENFKNQKFKLFQNGKLVYGNQIEAPAKGFPLEYRNIPVSSLNKNNFRLNINADFDIKIGKGSFTTVQQRNYDDKYEIIQDGDVFYSLRGNTTNPSKILITFPGFGPSTTRISYAISYLKALTEDDLQNTLMICFQDRYLVSGSYMMVDSARRPLYPRVKSVIDHFMRLYSIDDDNMLLFGASKGGSIALHYAQEFPRARLLIAVPQLNLPYYMNKPFFRYNLFEVKAFHEMIQPEQLLRKYLTEGRRIDYFYTNNDELSNHSVIELAHGVKGLTKYRFNGTHGEVAKAALPTMLNIIREFLGQATNKKIICEDALTYKTEDRLYAQVRIQDDIENNNPANWYLEANDGGTILRVAMTNHTYGFVKYTSPSQAIFPSYDPISSFNKIIGSFDTGLTYIGKLPHKLENNSESQEQINRSFSPLCLNTEKKY
ncbi:hypothetical protein [Rothia aerolata]|uniref:Accessory Sec system protein Asp2 n=1 Tax=Rothia aerolata TaxID=1812262 RepID=A0A917MUL3_9MICC|nr:hypothetical protein [Rothia aerolata]GGH65096.1 hypothetical protein GCM10007359_18000 [Rothia aerolata]